MVLGAMALFMCIGVLFNLYRLLQRFICEIDANKRKTAQECETEEYTEDEYPDEDEDNDEMSIFEISLLDCDKSQIENRSDNLSGGREAR
jgi:hypothetical protein